MLLIVAACGCGSNGGKTPETINYHWIDDGNVEIIMTQRGNVFRGEFFDPNSRNWESVPFAGIIDSEGNINGIGFDSQNGNMYAEFQGQITGNTFDAKWLPIDPWGGRKSMKMKQRNLTTDVEQQIAKHKDVFYNWLCPERELCNQNTASVSRVIPFLPEKLVVESGRLYGYQNNQWDIRSIKIMPADNPKEVDFQINIKQNTRSLIEVNMKGTAKLTDNTFRHRQGDYEFEVAIYNGFVAITTIAGFVDLDLQQNVSQNANMVEDDEFTIDGVYPLNKDGLTDNVYDFEFNYYSDGKSYKKDDSEWDEYGEYGEGNASDIITMMGYLKYNDDDSGGDLSFLFDEVLMIKSHETEKLRQYGYDPDVDIIENDYVLINEKEEWTTIVTNAGVTYTVVVYDDNADMVVNFKEVDREQFLQHIGNGRILSTITISLYGTLYEIKQVYVP